MFFDPLKSILWCCQKNITKLRARSFPVWYEMFLGVTMWICLELVERREHSWNNNQQQGLKCTYLDHLVYISNISTFFCFFIHNADTTIYCWRTCNCHPLQIISPLAMDITWLLFRLFHRTWGISKRFPFWNTKHKTGWQAPSLFDFPFMVISLGWLVRDLINSWMLC